MPERKRKDAKDNPAEGEMPMRDFDEVMKALLKVPPKHRSNKQPQKKKTGE